MNVSSFSAFVNTILKYYDSQGLNEKLILMFNSCVVIYFISKKLLVHELFNSMCSWAEKYFFEKFVKPSNPRLTYLIYTP